MAELKEGRGSSKQDQSLEKRLIAHGVTSARAKKLSVSYERERIEKILSHFEAEVLARGKREIESPGACLATAIENDEFKLPEDKVVRHSQSSDT
jgi:hypothetical protein